LTEQERYPKSRSYQMRKRAEQMDETRRRIIEAAVNLHGTVGPTETGVAGIAREAGVTRLTVYRHFPDEEAIYAACSAHWLSGQVPPDPTAWSRIADPVERLRTGLADLYRFYREGEAMLTRVYRDKAALPSGRRQALDDRDGHHRDVLLDPFLAHRGSRRRLRAVVGHAASFGTWRSLCVEQDLLDREAVEAMIALVVATASPHRGALSLR
jgi:AcrR family transcriptional regulator